MREPLSRIAILCTALVVACGLTACTSSFLHTAATQSQAVEQTTQSQNPTTAPATAWEPIARPVVQTIGQAAGPAGQDILAMIAALAGGAGTLFTYLAKQKSDSTNQAAIAELSTKVPATTNLSTKTTAVVRRVTGS